MRSSLHLANYSIERINNAETVLGIGRSEREKIELELIRINKGNCKRSMER